MNDDLSGYTDASATLPPLVRDQRQKKTGSRRMDRLKSVHVYDRPDGEVHRFV